jgi:hypothetical protein
MLGMGLRKSAADRLRAATALLLGGTDYAGLLLGPPPLSPAPHEELANTALAAVLEPYRRRLWRDRASLVLARGLMLVGCLALAGAVGTRWLPWLSGATVVVALGLIAALCWQCLAQRPSSAETAQWLDRQFGLREQLGTALEYGGTANPGNLAAAQAAAALALARRLPPQALAIRQRGPWTGAVLAGLAVSLALIAGSHASARPQAVGALSHTQARARTQAHAGVTAVARQQASATVAEVAAPRSALPSQKPPATSSGGRRGMAPRAPLLAASLQVGAGPALVGANAPVTQAGTMAGSLGPAQATKAPRPGGHLSTTLSGTGSGSPPPGSTPAGHDRSQSGDPQGTGKTGGAATNQAAATASQGAAGGQTLTNQPPPDSRQGPMATPGARAERAATAGTTAPNPFGQDPAGAPAGPRRAAPATGKGAHGPSGDQKGTPPSGGGAPSAAGSSAAAGHSGAQDPSRRPGTHGPLPGDAGSKQPAAPGENKGPVRVHTVQVQGKADLGAGGQGPDLVRVIPFGASGAESLLGPPGSSAVVSGYVPEEGFMLSAEAQALVRSYFASGTTP